MNRRVMYGFKEFTNFEDAIKKFRERVNLCDDVERVETKNSLGRILANEIRSPLDLPPFDRSVVDGYAVRSIDVSGASPSNPITLKIVGKIFADTEYNLSLGKDESVEIFTGGRIPSGADCVLMAEDCRRDGNELIVFKQCFSMQNISRRGEDFMAGETVLNAGTVIKPFHLGALISLGIREIDVLRRARISVISTGNEIHDIDDGSHGTIDATRPMIISSIRDMGLDPVDMGTVPDDEELIIKKLEEALASSDMVVITGGTSIGEHDLVPDAVNHVAKPGIIVHGISMRPARTTGFAFHGNKPILMISGFPVAAYISSNIFLREFFEKFYGTKLDPPPTIRGRLTMRWPNQAGIRSFVRVIVRRVGNEYTVEPLRLTGSGILSTLTRANGLLVIDEKSEGYDEGDYVDVIITQPVEVIK
ncbi:MAG: molybdopterin molybdenumtransferase MoeA [Aciduliprofundum sp.]|nr:MAG: molybdopterin molybdenumtransferase MoeA [Aciduliprofundum sp.]